MAEKPDSLRTIAYAIIGLLALIAAVQIVGIVLHLVAHLAAAVLSVALLVAVGYLVYRIVKAAVESAN